MSRSDIHHVSAEHRGRNDPSVHGGRSVREAVQAEKTYSDTVVQQKRRNLSKRRHSVSHVSRR